MNKKEYFKKLSQKYIWLCQKISDIIELDKDEDSCNILNSFYEKCLNIQSQYNTRFMELDRDKSRERRDYSDSLWDDIGEIEKRAMRRDLKNNK